MSERMSAVLESITDAFLVLAPDWTITYLNPQVTELLSPDSDAATLIGQPLWRALPGLCGTMLEAQLRRALEQQQAASFELYYPPRQQWLDVRAWPSKAGLAASLHNISQRKSDERTLRDSADRLQMALAAGKIGDWAWDAATNEVTLGRRAADLFGLPGECTVSWEALAGHLFEDDRAEATAAFLRAVTARADLTMECRIVRQNGERRWLSVIGFGNDGGNDGDDGAPLGMTGMVQDISDRKRAQHALHQNQDDMQAMANSIPQPAWIARFDGAGVWYNECWYEYTGLSRDLAPAGGWEEVYDPECLPAIRQHWQRSLRSGEPFEMEFPIRGADGQFRWFLSRANPVRDSTGRITGWFGTSTDVDQQKRAQQALRDEIAIRELLNKTGSARAEAERASQMKDEFLATLSHELRTPLTAILGWAQVLRRGSRDEADLHKGLQTIERNARAQAQLIEDLLDMSRITSGKVLLDLQLLSPLTIIDAAMEAVRPAADAKAITLRRDFSATGMVAADAGRLQQVIWNLLSNAIKFTPTGGAVMVRANETDGHVVITIGDTGIGIRPEFIAHVFERFRQADSTTTRRHGGLGLGLSIVKHLVEQHGGTVAASSAGEGLGASFTVNLPRANGGPSSQHQHRIPAVAPLPPAAKQDAGRCDLDGLRVLVVDDEPDARDLIKRILNDCNATVSTANNAQEALTLVESTRPQLLVSDLGMPDIDGFELLAQVRALGPDRGGNVPAIALTAFARSEDRLKALESGFRNHVSKPVEPAELINAIALCL
ncbi:MAG: response regulator [Burkholderiaceae bacterium]|nr:response regulator [Burkholderiaceae bacterium]